MHLYLNSFCTSLAGFGGGCAVHYWVNVCMSLGGLSSTSLPNTFLFFYFLLFVICICDTFIGGYGGAGQKERGGCYKQDYGDSTCFGSGFPCTKLCSVYD